MATSAIDVIVLISSAVSMLSFLGLAIASVYTAVKNHFRFKWVRSMTILMSVLFGSLFLETAIILYERAVNYSAGSPIELAYSSTLFAVVSALVAISSTGLFVNLFNSYNDLREGGQE